MEKKYEVREYDMRISDWESKEGDVCGTDLTYWEARTLKVIAPDHILRVVAEIK